MINKMKKILLITLLPVLLSGCWDYEDINNIYDQLYTYQKSGDNHETIKKD